MDKKMSFSVCFQNYNIYLLLAAAEGEWSSFVHISKQEISQIFASELVPKHINIDSVTVSLFVHVKKYDMKEQQILLHI